MPRELCYGGSFDPIHLGHVAVVRAAADAVQAERVRLLVAAQSPFKTGVSTPAAPEHRLAMCRLAVAADPRIDIDDREIRRDGPSYTSRTAAERSLESGRPVHWLIGADLLAGLPRWHDAATLLADPPTLVRFIVMRRPGYAIDWATLPHEVQHLRENVVEVPQVPVSSSQVRAAVVTGEPIDALVGPDVSRYIERHGLYL